MPRLLRIALLAFVLALAGTSLAPSAWALDPPVLSATTASPTNGNPGLSWTPVMGVVIYTVERASGDCSAPDFAPIGTLLLFETTFSDTGIATDGTYCYRVIANDGLLTPDGISNNVAITVDRTPPTVAITAGPSGPTADSTPTFEFSSPDGVLLTCHIPGIAGPGPCPSPFTPSEALADGSYTFSVTATDSAGNTGAPATRAFSVDTRGAAATITGGPSSATTDTTPTFTFTSEAGAAFECQVDDAAWLVCASPRTTGSLGDGPHRFEVRASDGVGNVGVVAVRRFTVDTADPNTSITAGPTGTTSARTAIFAFSSNELGASFQCRLDGAAFGACNGQGSHTLNGLSDDSHAFQVRAVDEAGNQDASPSVRTWTIAQAAGPGPDSSGPAAPTGFSISFAVGKKGERQVVLRWKNPTAADFASVAILRNAAHRPAKLSDGKVVYRGRSTRAVIAGTPGTARWFRIFSRDTTGNTTAGPSKRVVIPALPSLRPLSGAKVHGAPHLSWKPVKGAQYYHVQVYVGASETNRVAIAWPKVTGYTVPASKLKRGVRYTWYVWPGYGAVSEGRFGKKIGSATFTYTGP